MNKRSTSFQNAKNKILGNLLNLHSLVKINIIIHIIIKIILLISDNNILIYQIIIYGKD